MKKLLLASAIAALSVSAAHAAPAIYGKVALATEYTDGQDFEDITLDDDGSRFGFKGSEALTDAGTSVTYKMEFGVKIDVKDSGKVKYEDSTGAEVAVKDDDSIYQRTTYVGLKNDAWGEVRFGNQGTVDAVSNEYSAFGGLEGEGDGRQSNNLVYIMPTMSGIDVSASYQIENSDDSDFALAATYAPDGAPFSFGAAYAMKESDGVDSEITLAGSYKVMPEFTAMVDYRMTDDGSSDNLNSFSVGGVYQLNEKQDVYAQIDGMNQGSADSMSFSTGTNYNFTDNAATGAYVGYNDGSEDVTVGASFEYSF